MTNGTQIGRQVGVFRIDSLLGVGGMGEVYRAHDTKLNRDVAIKVLPPAFAADPDRLARFKREAQVLASLNHPNIGGIYGFEDDAGVHALVLELVEGPTLADTLELAHGLEGLPLDEALAIAQSDRRGARSRARAGDHPSRSEARQHQGARRRHREGAGLRTREASTQPDAAAQAGVDCNRRRSRRRR